MRQRRALTWVFMLTWVGAASLKTAAVAQSPAVLPAWIPGCWEGTRGAERFSERWLAADGTTLIGVAHTVKDGKLSAFEFLRIVARGDRLVYIAQPNGAPPTEFTAAPADRSSAAITFANPQHDFPKRVGYQQAGTTGLTAWIDGGAGGGSRIEYAMTRIDCGP